MHIKTFLPKYANIIYLLFFLKKKIPVTDKIRLLVIVEPTFVIFSFPMVTDAQ